MKGRNPSRPVVLPVKQFTPYSMQAPPDAGYDPWPFVNCGGIIIPAGLQLGNSLLCSDGKADSGGRDHRDLQPYCPVGGGHPRGLDWKRRYGAFNRRNFTSRCSTSWKCSPKLQTLSTLFICVYPRFGYIRPASDINHTPLPSMLYENSGRLVYKYDAEQLWIEPWGPNALRVRATKMSTMPAEDWALQPPPSIKPQLVISDADGSIVNGKIRASVTKLGKLMVWNGQGDLLLEEYVRNRRDLLDPKCSAIEVEGREFKPIKGGGDFCHLTARFESVDPDEKIFGMGQYQQPYLDLKGLDLELAHRNSQASVPFALSSLGYGFLWNNPSVGRAVLGKNIMSFEAYSTTVLDYWIVAGDTPAEIEEAYATATGKVPMMPDYGLGFWQCKLRYQTQSELLEVAREYKRRDLPIDLIVIDFFHWPKQGEWKFDPVYWPDPGTRPLPSPKFYPSYGKVSELLRLTTEIDRRND